MVEQLYKDSEVGLIPNDWELKTVEPGIGKVKSGKRLPKGYSLVSIPNSHPYIRVSDMCEGGINLSGIMYVPDDIYPCIENYRIFIEDVFISVAGTLGVIGKIPYLLNGANLTENANKITDLSIDRDFLMYWLSGNYIQSKINDCKTIGAQPKLALYNIRNFPVPVPSIHEQRRIAQALSDTDDLISSMEKLIAKKQNLKKAMMQELLTGKRRLDGFTDEWKEVELGKICDIEMGQSPDSISYNNKYHGLPLIQGKADIDEKSRETIKSVYTTEPKKIALTGDLVFTVRAPVGYVARVTFDCCIGRGVCAIKNVSPFLYYKLISLEKSWSDKASGSVFDSINGDVLRNAKIMVPKSSVEQDAISKVIKGLETEITSNYLKLEKLKLIKQAMMQELLTGHIRLLEQRG